MSSITVWHSAKKSRVHGPWPDLQLSTCLHVFDKHLCLAVGMQPSDFLFLRTSVNSVFERVSIVCKNSGDAKSVLARHQMLQQNHGVQFELEHEHRQLHTVWYGHASGNMQAIQSSTNLRAIVESFWGLLTSELLLDSSRTNPNDWDGEKDLNADENKRRHDAACKTTSEPQSNRVDVTCGKSLQKMRLKHSGEFVSRVNSHRERTSANCRTVHCASQCDSVIVFAPATVTAVLPLCSTCHVLF